MREARMTEPCNGAIRVFKSEVYRRCYVICAGTPNMADGMYVPLAEFERLKADAERLADLLGRIRPCKECHGTALRKPDWGSGKNGCPRCNGYGHEFMRNRQQLRDALRAAAETGVENG